MMIDGMLTRTPFNGKRITGHVCGVPSLEVAEMIDQGGVELPAKEKPKGIRFRRPGYCYINSQRLAAQHSDRFIYMQGLALLPNDPGSDFEQPWRGHGWCVDTTDGRVVDVTWQTPGVRYIGLPIDRESCDRLRKWLPRK